MQCLRSQTPKACRVSKTVPIYINTNARNMSLFPRFAAGEFTPLFRLLDDYASHSLNRGGFPAFPTTSLKSFQPRFDVKEGKDAYELEGELPGIDQSNVEIEFTDPQTLSIRGRTEHHRESGTRPSAAVQDQPEPAKLTNTEADTAADTAKYQQPSVEDEDTVLVDTPATSEKAEVAPSAPEQATPQQQPEKQEPDYKYYVSERSTGSFQRTFNFAARIDQDNVKASLKNGVLSIVVPKAQAPTARRINIE